MKHATLTRRFEVKAIDEEARTFEGLLSVYDPDLGGDKVKPGAFKRTLADWRKAKGKVIPLIDSHARSSVRAVVGKMTEAEERDAGLWTQWELLAAGDPDADAVYRRLKGGVISKMSMGYRAIKTRAPTDVERMSGIYRHLDEVALEEGSVVVFPMAPGAAIDLDSVKSLLDADPADEAARAELKQMHDAIGALLASTTPGHAPDSKDAGLAQEDPRRLALEAAYRDLTLRGLGAR